MNDGIRIGVLLSGGGSNLQAIMAACGRGQIDGQVVFVGSDKPGAYGLARAEKKGIPTFVTDYRNVVGSLESDSLKTRVPADFDVEHVLASQQITSETWDKEKRIAYLSKRAIFEAALLQDMAQYDFDLLVLAGFMRVLSPYFIDRVNTVADQPRIMNIHPALLPAFPGVDGYGDTYRYGCKVGGCTVHFVDYGEDTGPIIGQRAFDILPQDTLESVREKGLHLEWQLYCDCIALFAQNQIKIAYRECRSRNGRVYNRKVVEIAA